MRRRPPASHGALRAVRGWALAACSATLAVAAHGMAGGDTPDTALIAVLTVLVAWIGTALADREYGTTTALVMLGLSQVSMHVLLSISETEPGHQAHSAPPVDPFAMTVTHVVATVLTAVLLARADLTLTRVVTGAALLLGLLRMLVYPPPATEPGVRVPAAPEETGHLIGVVLRRVCARRGPPFRC